MSIVSSFFGPLLSNYHPIVWRHSNSSNYNRKQFFYRSGYVRGHRKWWLWSSLGNALGSVMLMMSPLILDASLIAGSCGRYCFASFRQAWLSTKKAVMWMITQDVTFREMRDSTFRTIQDNIFMTELEGTGMMVREGTREIQMADTVGSLMVNKI